MPTTRRLSLGLLSIALGSLSGCSAGDADSSAPNDSKQPETSSGGQGLSPTSAVDRIRKNLPNANVRSEGRRLRRLFGPLGQGATADEAAENFRRQGAKELGVRPEELAPVSRSPFVPSSSVQSGAPGGQGGPPKALSGSPQASTTPAGGVGLMFDPSTGKYKFRLYAYQQQRDGISVYDGALRTLVREGNDPTVVWVNTDLRPLGDFQVKGDVPPFTLNEEQPLSALNDASLIDEPSPPRQLADFSSPTPTIFAGVGERFTAPRLAVRYTAHDSDGPGSWTFVADASTGDILHVESNLHYDIDGTVEAEVVGGVEAMECGSLAIEAFAHARVTSPVGDAVADQDGFFSIAESGSGVVDVVSSVTGQFFDINDASGNAHSLTLSVAPPGPAHFLHQDPSTPPEIVLAQLNAYTQVNALRDMLVSYVPDYPVISTETGFLVNVNRTGDSPMDLCARTGGAWYDDESVTASINFCQRTASRTNTAMGSIVHHEYGHHIIDSGGSRQSEYGEGMADTIAMLFSGDPRIGLGYGLNCGEPLREADSDCQYDETDCSSCGAGIYECGSLISGTVWDIWQLLAMSEPGDADDIVRSLVFSSIPMHTGSSIDPSIAIDLLTLDDDDALLENGTPHYEEICSGFQMHNMDCPAIVDGLVVHGSTLSAAGPSDGPFEPSSFDYTLYNLGPEESLAYSVVIPPGVSWLSVDSPSGTIALGEQTTVTVSIDQVAAAQLADGRYSAVIDFINETSGVGTVSRDANLRVGEPQPVYVATFDADLEGFEIGSELDNLWHRTSTCVDELPGHSAPGSLYYGRDDQCSHSTSVPDRHTILSPVIPIENPTVADLSFNYYLRTERPGSDIVEVSIAVDGGPFQVLVSNAENGGQLLETNAWTQLRTEITDLLPSGPTSIQLELAFDAGSPGDNNETGFLIDDITVYGSPVSSDGVLVPARIEAEDYVRYNDTTPGNEGGGCDTGDDVDKEVTGDSAGGGCNVGWTQPGEWLEYDITVSNAQTFDIVSRVASDFAGKTFRIEIDGVDVTGALAVPQAGWQNYSDVTAEGISLSAGDHVVRLYMITDYINVNYVEFVPSGTGTSCGDGMCGVTEDCGTCPYDCGVCSGVELPARIEAEDYVRANDTTPGNEGEGCETGDDVDKEITGDSAGGGCNVGWTEAGEWLEYDVSVSSAQTFDIVARVASGSSGKSFRIEVDGVDVTGALSVPQMGWQSYSDVVVAGIPLSAGDHVVRLYMITNYININYIEFVPSGSQNPCGDGMCEASEDCGSCPADCGTCPGEGGCTCPSGCDAIQSASVPFVANGVQDTCYFFSGSAGEYINSWNMTQVNLNGQNATNFWLGSGSYPAAVDGGYYLYVRGELGWSHVEVY